MSIEQKAKSLAFEKFDESCPIVENIISKAQESLVSEIQEVVSEALDKDTLEETSQSLNLPISDLLQDTVKNEILMQVESQVEKELVSIEKKIKDQVTYQFRDALVEACQELLVVQQERDDLDSENSDLKEELSEQKNEVESLENKVDKLETERSELIDEITRLEMELRQSKLICA